MLDFEYPCKIRTKGRAIYVETSQPRNRYCEFQYDMAYLGALFPEFNFYCTSNQDPDIPNVISCGDRNLVELSFISNGCEAIIGKGSGAFLCTYTECNRKKPRAVVNFTAPHFWDYRDNPLEYLKGQDELISFLAKVLKDPWEVI
jgi:hypothetical protein